MCQYWKKMHTCNHQSDRPYIEMCRPGFLSNTVCPDIGEDDKLRPSHFPCYPCIKLEARAETEAQARLDEDAIAKAYEARERAVKEKQAAELRAKEERVRREARDKAAKEREAEQRAKREKEEQERKARKEGGTWVETSGNKKPKGRKSGSVVGLSLAAPNTPTSIMVTAPKNTKENSGGAAAAGYGGERMSPKNSRVDPGGRAGTWGPKKILSRQENGVGVGVGVAS
ncbi:Uup ATPase component of ABC transporter with duplicated ATPase domains [Pyrenophora tritici-repentis]|nr:Uup ATPase component of ABC transporter with duplicated ATPase domains [Pyrenophora tritici-repentis]KAI1547959.1 hypothetical protein PtrSN001A_001397 [Pyrenophora tritici-repentis]KAI1586288.1 hypothetical protein PtrEW7m1_001746 [Pyrenophora tritici-repentis]KAI1592256.1 hypothetical protein PtrEW13061_003927 [Pyrenophora tritici-repentis]